MISELIKNKENLGFAAGNNTGIKHALKHEADFILLLNNDTLVDRDKLILKPEDTLSSEYYFEDALGKEYNYVINAACPSTRFKAKTNQILDFKEVFDGGLERFCRTIMEPYRLYHRGGFAQIFARFMRQQE